MTRPDQEIRGQRCRLPAIDDRLDNIGREECEIDKVGHPALGCTFEFSNCLHADSRLDLLKPAPASCHVSKKCPVDTCCAVSRDKSRFDPALAKRESAGQRQGIGIDVTRYYTEVLCKVREITRFARSSVTDKDLGSIRPDWVIAFNVLPRLALLNDVESSRAGMKTLYIEPLPPWKDSYNGSCNENSGTNC